MKSIPLPSEYANCNLCGADNTELLFTVSENRFRLGGSFSLVRCKRCGLVYLNPRPTKEGIAVFYPKDRYHPPGKSSRSVPLGQRVKDLVIKSLPGYDAKTSTLRKLLGMFLGTFLSGQIDIIVPVRPNGRILDVGCGDGQVIGWMKEYGWKTYGVDVSKEACEQAASRGVSVSCGELQEADYPQDFFDAIVIHHTLEHLHNPLVLLKECFRILNKEGDLIIDAPNFECFQSQLFGPSWFAIDAPRHLYHFTQDTLGKMLTIAGFRINKWKFQFPFPFRESASLRFYMDGNKKTIFLSFLRRWLEANCFVIFRYILGKNRGPRFSINLTVYASKSNWGKEEATFGQQALSSRQRIGKYGFAL